MYIWAYNGFKGLELFFAFDFGVYIRERRKWDKEAERVRAHYKRLSLCQGSLWLVNVLHRALTPVWPLADWPGHTHIHYET